MTRLHVRGIAGITDNKNQVDALHRKGMKKKFWGFQSYWKWYGFAMTLLVTIFSASVHARHLRNQHNHRKKLTRDMSGQSVLTNISMDDYTIGSQLERIVPMPNTTEYYFDATSEKHCKYLS